MRPAPDLVERRFTANGTNQHWVADITYVPTQRAFFMSPLCWTCSARRVVGWSMSPDLRTWRVG